VIGRRLRRYATLHSLHYATTTLQLELRYVHTSSNPNDAIALFAHIAAPCPRSRRSFSTLTALALPVYVTLRPRPKNRRPKTSPEKQISGHRWPRAEASSPRPNFFGQSINRGFPKKVCGWFTQLTQQPPPTTHTDPAKPALPRKLTRRRCRCAVACSSAALAREEGAAPTSTALLCQVCTAECSQVLTVAAIGSSSCMNRQSEPMRPRRSPCAPCAQWAGH
jgi:hypothetical protein